MVGQLWVDDSPVQEKGVFGLDLNLAVRRVHVDYDGSLLDWSRGEGRVIRRQQRPHLGF